MTKCDYIESYPDVVTEKEIIFECKEKAFKSKKCKFHLEGYLTKDTEKEVEELFSKKLKKVKKILQTARGDKKIFLKCVGYILPSISLLEKNEKEVQIYVNFAHAKFKEDINFSGVVFKKEVSFHKTIFFKSTKISGSVFEEPIDFSFSEFQKSKNSFQSTKFLNKVNFSNATLTNMDFGWANFKEVRFIECKFSEKTVFNNAIFFKESNFGKSEFLEDVDFSGTHFHTNANFGHAKFSVFANFSNVEFKDGDIKFNGNIANVSFLDTNIKKINFGNRISWKLIHNFDSDDNLNSDMNRKNSDFMIYEERLLEKKEELEINLESIKNIYRDLRENFEMNLQYDIAGEFFIREMELKRKYKEELRDRKLIAKTKRLCSRTLTPYWIYNIIAQYGESIRRPLYFAIPIISIGIYLFWSECTAQIEMNLKDPCDPSPLSILIRSLSAFIPFFTFVEKPSIVDYGLRLLLLPISGTFFIALKRRFERKLRH